MTEINANVAVGENVPPQQEQYLVQIANDSYTEERFEVYPDLEKMDFQKLWLRVIDSGRLQHSVSLEVYFGAAYFEYVCAASEWMTTWLSRRIQTKGIFSKLDGVLCRVSLSGECSLLRVVFVFEEQVRLAPEVFAYKVAAYWRECVMRRFNFWKEIERIPLEPGLGPIAYHCTSSEVVQFERFAWLLSGHRIYGDNTAQKEYFCGRHTTEKEPRDNV